MKVSTEPIENRQVLLNVEMDADEMEKALEEAYRHLVGRVFVPGFRKGKTPRAVLENHVGRDALLQEALERLIPQAYEEALVKQEIDAIAQPEIELVQSEPLVFKAIVPVRPVVKLGDYRELRLESDPVEVTDEDKEVAIDQLRHQHAVWVPVERPVCFNDMVTIDIEGKSQGESFLIRKDLTYRVTRDSPLPLPGFAEKLEGIERNVKKEFVLSFPNDYETKELAGREFAFEVVVGEIKEEQLPEVDDEFAKSFNFDNLDSLKQQVADDLQARAEERSRLEFEQKVVNAVIDLSELEYPPVLVDKEIDRLLSEESRGFTEGVSGLENYLATINKTMEEHREELRNMATQHVIQSLVLDKIAEEEAIEVSASDIDDEIAKMAKGTDEQAEEIRKFFSLPQARESVKQFLLPRKAVEQLVQIAKGLV